LFSAGTYKHRGTVVGQAADKPGVQVFYLENGVGTLELPNRTLPLLPGQVLMYSLHERRYRFPSGHTWCSNGFRFGGATLPLWIDELGLENDPLVPTSLRRLAVRTARQLVVTARRQLTGWQVEVHRLLDRWMTAMLMQRKPPTEAELPESVRRLLDRIAADPRRDWQICELAATAEIGYTALRAEFRRSLGCTLHEHLQQVRADQARILLRDDRLSIKQIARELHFPSAAYFSRFFKKQTGRSPLDYRVNGCRSR
jgi:AraC-like DNA-binding protein